MLRCVYALFHLPFLYQNLAKVLIDFGLFFCYTKSLLLDFSFSIGIDIVQVTFNLLCVFKKDYILNFKLKNASV